jgi:hypothetical protein
MMERKPNLLSTHDIAYPSESRLEVGDLLGAVRGRASVVGVDVRGVIKLAADEEPRRLVRRLRYLHAIQPDRFSYTRSWVPADFWCGSDPDSVVDLAIKVAGGIHKSESWKIVLKRAKCPSSNLLPLVRTLSHRIARPRPDLMNPDKVLYIHLIGREAAVSLLRSDEMLEIPSQPASLLFDSKAGSEVSVG